MLLTFTYVHLAQIIHYQFFCNIIKVDMEDMICNIQDREKGKVEKNKWRKIQSPKVTRLFVEKCVCMYVVCVCIHISE